MNVDAFLAEMDHMEQLLKSPNSANPSSQNQKTQLSPLANSEDSPKRSSAKTVVRQSPPTSTDHQPDTDYAQYQMQHYSPNEQPQNQQYQPNNQISHNVEHKEQHFPEIENLMASRAAERETLLSIVSAQDQRIAELEAAIGKLENEKLQITQNLGHAIELAKQDLRSEAERKLRERMAVQIKREIMDNISTVQRQSIIETITEDELMGTKPLADLKQQLKLENQRALQTRIAEIDRIRADAEDKSKIKQMEATCKRQIQQIQSQCAREVAVVQGQLQQSKQKIQQHEKDEEQREEITRALNQQVLTANEQLMAVQRQLDQQLTDNQKFSHQNQLLEEEVDKLKHAVQGLQEQLIQQKINQQNKYIEAKLSTTQKVYTEPVQYQQPQLQKPVDIPTQPPQQQQNYDYSQQEQPLQRHSKPAEADVIQQMKDKYLGQQQQAQPAKSQNMKRTDILNMTNTSPQVQQFQSQIQNQPIVRSPMIAEQHVSRPQKMAKSQLDVFQEIVGGQPTKKSVLNKQIQMTPLQLQQKAEANAQLEFQSLQSPKFDGQLGPLFAKAWQFTVNLWDENETSFISRVNFVKNLSGDVQEALKTVKSELNELKKVNQNMSDVMPLIKKREMSKPKVDKQLNDQIMSKLQNGIVSYRGVDYLEVMKAEGAAQ